MRDYLAIAWLRIRPKGLSGLAAPVLTVYSVFWATDWLQSNGLIADVSRDLIAAVIGCIIVWIVAVIMLPRGQEERRHG